VKFQIFVTLRTSAKAMVSRIWKLSIAHKCARQSESCATSDVGQLGEAAAEELVCGRAIDGTRKIAAETCDRDEGVGDRSSIASPVLNSMRRPP